MTSPPTPPAHRILVVDDEEPIRELLSASLRFQGFAVETAPSGTAALDKARAAPPDALIVDVMMPGMDGFRLLSRLRSLQIDAPVLFLTARDSLADKLSGLSLGADDYVTKPFSLEEVIARLRVILRRASPPEQASDSMLRFADIELDENSHEVRKAGALVALSPTEFSLLRYLMANAGTVLSKARILDHVWNYDFNGDGRIVESYISYLRKKIDTGEAPLIHTIRGIGYVLRQPR